MTIVSVLASFVGIAAFGAWFVAAGSAIAMVGHRAPGVTLWHLATHGIAFFDDRCFTAEAAPHRARFVRAFGAFFVLVFLGVALGVLAAPPTP